MWSSLGPILARIFMVELENNVIPTLIDNITFWQRIVDNTVAFVKNDSIGYILENNNGLPFLDRLLIKKAYNINAKAYRKWTNTDLYLNWKFSCTSCMEKRKVISKKKSNS